MVTKHISWTCYNSLMNAQNSAEILTNRAIEFAAAELGKPVDQLTITPTSGGFSRNRRALVSAGDRTIFVKEVDVAVLPDEGERELAWLKKDYEMVQLLQTKHPELAADWVKLSDDGHVLLMTAYPTSEGWLWSPPTDPETVDDYIDAVVRTVRVLEDAQFDEATVERLQLEPHFRDEIALDNKYPSIYDDAPTRQQLIEKYQALADQNDKNAHRYTAMVHLLNDETALRQLQQAAYKLAEQPQDKFNHCDVRSDNLAYHPNANTVKLVDWNWASYAPSRFGTTEFLLDMARHDHDITPWFDQLNPALLAASVNFFAVRCLQPPLAPDSALCDMQLTSAATAYELYQQTKSNCVANPKVH